MDEVFTRIYLQYFLKVTGRCSFLPFLVNLSLVSSMKKDKSENVGSAASPTENQNTRQWQTRTDSSGNMLRIHLCTQLTGTVKTATNRNGSAGPNSSSSVSLPEQTNNTLKTTENYRIAWPTPARIENDYLGNLESAFSLLNSTGQCFLAWMGPVDPRAILATISLAGDNSLILFTYMLVAHVKILCGF